MNFCTTSPVTRILHFRVICLLHVHMFTKTTLSGLILSCWLLIYAIVHVTSCNKSGHLRGCPNVQFLREKKRGGRTFAKLPPHLPQPVPTLEWGMCCFGQKKVSTELKCLTIFHPLSPFSLMTLLQLCFGSPLPALVHCSLPPVLAVLAPVLWSTRLNPSECIDCPDEAVITAYRWLLKRRNAEKMK